MNILSTQVYHSPCGDLLLGSFEGKLCLCDWVDRSQRDMVDRRIKKRLDVVYQEQVTDVLDEAKKQLDQYFSGKRTTFDVPLAFFGTDFQKTVWQGLCDIPFGTTMSYKQLAEHIQNPKAIRALGTANGANGLSIFVPCHRVVGHDGSLVGYAGGLEAKKFLLDFERKKI